MQVLFFMLRLRRLCLHCSPFTIVHIVIVFKLGDMGNISMCTMIDFPAIFDLSRFPV